MPAVNTERTAESRMRRFPIWRILFGLLMAAGLYATYLRIVGGLGAVTNLNDSFPWGIWIGFDILCGVGLAAGGFTLVAVVQIFNIQKYRPILRPAILTAFLGYVLVILALMFDLGRPDRIWHALIMWNPHSVMFEVAWCVMLYTTVLALEFSPVVFEKFGWEKPIRIVHAISVPLIILGVILSTLHQSSLGSLYLIVPTKLHALWYTPMLPIFFFISAITVGLAMTIFESYHSAKAFGKALEWDLVNGLARILAVALSVLLVFRFMDLAGRGVLHLAMENTLEAWLFGLEVVLMLLPALLLYRSHVRRNVRAMYLCALMAVFGFIANRLNVSITGIEAGSGTSYIPKWTEVAVTLAIIALGFAIFRLAAQHLPVFAEHDAHGE
ncbi:MAG: Ni/Fe-hydrogenase cytochrome b subunit [Bryobacterales bacterium]|nr:Ni/Fe-hydrogenase cytochrome b subunit [Bryobacterales bacterium]